LQRTNYEDTILQQLFETGHKNTFLSNVDMQDAVRLPLDHTCKNIIFGTKCLNYNESL